MSKIELKEYEALNDLLLLQWGDGSENALPLKSLRDNCPCANCAGETDVFGNIYRGDTKTLPSKSFQISSYEKVGLYGLRFFWEDGHNDGIYTAVKLKSLGYNG